MTKTDNSSNQPVPLNPKDIQTGSSVSVGDTVISVDPYYYSPTEVDLLIGDPSKAKEKLDWQAETKLDELVKIMVASDFKKVVEKGY